LTPLESRLLSSLARASGRVVRREALVDAGWGDDINGGPDNALRSVYVHVCHLRKRLTKAGFPGRINSVWGIGYELTLRAA
jgi:DNA-binding response OmpR family regulator